jgi:hypothetical protein
MTNALKLGLMLICCMITAACATTNRAGISEEFEKSYKAYNRLLRWDEVASAGMLYMEPEGREEFIKSAESIKKRAVSITEYRILTAECLVDKGTGEVVTEFDYYIMPSNRIKTLTYKQSWVYREINENKGWKIKSALPRFE